jgi:D-xylose transport system substrate-binding protein
MSSPVEETFVPTLRLLAIALLTAAIAGCSKPAPDAPDNSSTPSPASGADVAAAPDAAKAVHIGMSFDSLLVERWQKDRDIFMAAAEKLGARCTFFSADGDAKKQNEQCDVLLGQDIDVLVIIPKSATAAARAVQKANDQGVPVLAYDRLILNCKLDVYLSFDNERVGQMQGEYLVSHKKKGRYFLLGGSPDDNNAKLFRAGQMKAIQPLVDSGDITIIGDQWADGWSPKKAREIVENMLVSAGTEVDVVVASNDGTAGGAIQALKAQGLDGKVMVSGQDADLQACKRILAGSQSMTVYKPLKKLATRAAEVAVQLGRSEKVAATSTINNGMMDVPAVLLDPLSLDKENLVEVLTGDGYYTEEALRSP